MMNSYGSLDLGHFAENFDHFTRPKHWKSLPFPGHEQSQNPIILGMGQNHPKILMDMHPQKRW
jgi:hypothetical protein